MSYSSKEVIRNFLIVSLILLVLSTLCYKLVKRKVTTMYHLTGDVTAKDVDSLSDIIDLYYLFLESALLLHIVACYLPMLFTAMEVGNLVASFLALGVFVIILIHFHYMKDFEETLFTIFEFIKENGISRQTSEDYYNLIVLYDDLDNMTIKNIKLDFLKKCDVKHPKDVLKIINGERTAEQRGMLSLNVNSTDKHESSVFYKIRRRLSKLSFIKLSLLLCVFVGLGCAIAPQLPQLSLILLSAACVITAMAEHNEDLINGDSDASSTLQGETLAKNSTSTQNTASQSGDLAKDSSTNAEASYNAVSYVNIQLLLDKIERNIQKGYKFRNIDIARYRNIYFKEIVNNCKAENLPETTIDGYAEVLNSLLDDMYNAELESAISESNAALATLQSLTQIDGIQKDSIQDFCVNGLQKTTESTDDSASDN